MKSTHDNYKYSDYMRSAYRELAASDRSVQVKKFIEYCETALDGFESGKVGLRDVGYAIAGAMFMKTVSDDPDLEEITLIAGNLELPAEVIGGERKAKKLYRELKTYIMKAKNRPASAGS